jgi:hypothetical protein
MQLPLYAFFAMCLAGTISSLIYFIYIMTKSEISATAKVCAAISCYFFFDAGLVVQFAFGPSGIRNIFELIGGILLLVISIDQSRKDLRDRGIVE